MTNMIARGYYSNAHDTDPINLNEYFKDHANDEEDELQIIKSDGLDAVSGLLFAHGPEAENLADEFRKHGIKYENLAAVSKADLELLGLKNKKTQNDILKSIADLPNQAPHYDDVVSNMNIDQYNFLVLENISNHLENLKTSLAAAEIKFSMVEPEDIMLGDKLYSSDILLTTIDRMLENTRKVEKSFLELKQKGEGSEIIVSKVGRVAWWRNFIGSTLLAGSVAASSYIFYKYWRQR